MRSWPELGPSGSTGLRRLAQHDARTAQVREYARFFRDNLVGCEASFVNDTGVQVGVRQTRQARGTHLLRNTDVLSGAKFSDGIARSIVVSLSPVVNSFHSGPGAAPSGRAALNSSCR